MNKLNTTSLKNYNTFGIDVNALQINELKTVEDAVNSVKEGVFTTPTHLILGGGSNVLLRSNFEGTVLLNRIKGIETVEEDDNSVVLEVGGGEVWHHLVQHCVENNWGGIENLSLIPGSVGAAPMQNIGAYGVELNSVFVYLKALNKQTGEIETFEKSECEFGYRTSIFKTSHKGKYLIVKVAIRLTKKNHVLRTDYGAIRSELENAKITNPTIKDISAAVIRIRESKLPNPAEIGNSGSFFKNPILPNTFVQELSKKFEGVPVYPVSDQASKVAAGWLIEKAGWKGKTMNNYGVHKKQALVLVNYGGATGEEIFQLSEEIIKDVRAQFGIELEREVNIV